LARLALQFRTFGSTVIQAIEVHIQSLQPQIAGLQPWLAAFHVFSYEKVTSAAAGHGYGMPWDGP